MIINLIKKIDENCIGCAFILLLNILGCFWRMSRTDDWDPRSWNHYPCVVVPGETLQKHRRQKTAGFVVICLKCIKLLSMVIY